MSYEPRILLEKKDLLAIENKLLAKEFDEKARVEKYLLEQLRYEPCIFKCKLSFPSCDHELLIMKPELSSFNAEVRKFLDKNKIYYAIDY